LRPFNYLSRASVSPELFIFFFPNLPTPVRCCPLLRIKPGIVSSQARFPYIYRFIGALSETRSSLAFRRCWNCQSLLRIAHVLSASYSLTFIVPASVPQLAASSRILLPGSPHHSKYTRPSPHSRGKLLLLTAPLSLSRSGVSFLFRSSVSLPPSLTRLLAHSRVFSGTLTCTAVNDKSDSVRVSASSGASRRRVETDVRVIRSAGAVRVKSLTPVASPLPCLARLSSVTPDKHVSHHRLLSPSDGRILQE